MSLVENRRIHTPYIFRFYSGEVLQRKYIDRANTKNQPNAFTIQLNTGLTIKQNVKDRIIGHHVSNVGHPLYVQFTLNAINTRHFICPFNIYTYPDEHS